MHPFAWKQIKILKGNSEKINERKFSSDHKHNHNTSQSVGTTNTTTKTSFSHQYDNTEMRRVSPTDMDTHTWSTTL